jgi:hypothetical protein
MIAFWYPFLDSIGIVREYYAQAPGFFGYGEELRALVPELWMRQRCLLIFEAV